jgi:hypothetical protein
MKFKKNPKFKTNHRSKFKTMGWCLGGAVLAAGTALQAQPAVEKLEKENQDLRKRLDALEASAKKEGTMASGAADKFPITAVSQTMISGFVQSSYFYNTKEPDDRKSNAYLWNTTHNSFSINKVKLTLASPAAERSGEKWDAAYRVSMIWGEDAPVLNTGSPVAGFEALREAYVEVNAPVGTGLNIKAGQLISLLNYESGDGGAANANFSQGNQWFFTGNGPAAGVQAGYTFTDWLDVKVRVQNGLYGGPVDINDSKTFIGSLGIKPCANGWISLIGFAGDGMPVSKSVTGGSVLAGMQFTEQFNAGLELDYFQFGPVGGGPDKDLWSAGVWLGYDFTPKVGVAFRGEYLDDVDGWGIKGVGFPGSGRGAASAIASPDADGDVASLTFTLNFRPTPSLKIQPEIRYDRTSYSGGFDGDKDRIIIGAGATYSF